MTSSWVAQQVPGETSPAVFSPRAPIGQESLVYIPTSYKSRVRLSLPWLKRLMTNRCRFMCC